MQIDDIDFKRLFEAAPALYMVLAPDPPHFTIVAARDAYVQAVSKRRDELVGRPVFDALPVDPEDETSRANSTESFLRVIDSKRADMMAVQRHGLERTAEEGGGFEAHYWSAVNTPVLDDQGEVLYILAAEEQWRRAARHRRNAALARRRDGGRDVSARSRSRPATGSYATPTSDSASWVAECALAPASS